MPRAYDVHRVKLPDGGTRIYRRRRWAGGPGRFTVLQASTYKYVPLIVLLAFPLVALGLSPGWATIIAGCVGIVGWNTIKRRRR